MWQMKSGTEESISRNSSSERLSRASSSLGAEVPSPDIREAYASTARESCAGAPPSTSALLGRGTSVVGPFQGT